MQSAYKTSQEVLGDRAWTIVPQNEADAEAWMIPRPQIEVEKIYIKLPPLLENEVRIKMTWAGMCHSDVMFAKNEWNLPLNGLYPLIPGHEIVGVVEQLGETAKTKFQIGQNVGFGVIRRTCGSCITCQEGLENVCPKVQWTYPPHSGGYAQRFQADADYFYSIPEGMDVSRAAPLFCAGITVYSPLKRFLKSGQKVAIAGIGGLGHLALYMADKIAPNIELTALSGRPEKEQECLSFGAHKFLVTNEENVKAHIGYFDFILFAASGGKLTSYISMLKQGGRLCFVGVPPSNQDPGIILFDLLKNKSICGSGLGSREETREMLQLCAKYNIYPKCEFVPYSKVNQFMDNLDKSAAKYRYVIDFSQ